MSTTMTPEKSTPAKKKVTAKGGKKTAKKTPKATAKKNGIGPVARAWEIFGKQPKAARKDQVAAAAKAGINENTAKTQYQRWLHRGDK